MAAIKLRKHERASEGGILYHPKASVFEQLAEEGIHIQEALRYYPYRATFDFECFFDTKHLPSDSAKFQCLLWHELLSVSVTTKVPRHEQPRCFNTDGDGGLFNASPTIYERDGVRHAANRVRRRVRRAGFVTDWVE